MKRGKKQGELPIFFRSFANTLQHMSKKEFIQDLWGAAYNDDLLSDTLQEQVRQKIQNTPNNLDKEPWSEKAFSHPERTIRLATSFSGIGAIEHAFDRLGLNHEIVFAGDIEPKCKKSYFANYPIEESQWHNDIHELDATPYKGKVDLFVGGAPCQAFSMVGKRRGFEDTRGTLFREFARVVN